MDNMYSNWDDIAELELFMDDFVEETVEANYSNTVAISFNQGLNILLISLSCSFCPRLTLPTMQLQMDAQTNHHVL
jgi:BarA-like signal transduction histidine kinase